MSDHSISIVPRQSTVAGKTDKARHIVDWLANEGVIGPDQTHCVLDMGQLGYPMGPHAGKAVREPSYLPKGLVASGLEVVLGRRIFTTFEIGLEWLHCPSCHQNIAKENWAFFDTWHCGEGDHLVCPKCGQGAPVHEYAFGPAWGFSDLGFTFWNWPGFQSAFVDAFARKLGVPVDVVYAHI